MKTTYRITTQIVKDGALQNVVDIVEFESELPPDQAGAFTLTNDYITRYEPLIVLEDAHQYLRDSYHTVEQPLGDPAQWTPYHKALCILEDAITKIDPEVGKQYTGVKVSL